MSLGLNDWLPLFIPGTIMYKIIKLTSWALKKTVKATVSNIPRKKMKLGTYLKPRTKL